MHTHRQGFSILGLVASAAVFSPVLCAQSAADIIAEHDKAYQEWMTSYRAASKEARQKLITKRPMPKVLFPRLFAIIDANAKSEDAMTAANWVITAGRAQGDDLNRAIATLLKHHVDSPDLDRVCISLSRVPTVASERFLSTLEKQSPHTKVKAQACQNLAELFKRQAALATQLKSADKARIEILTAAYGRESIDILKSADPASLEKVAEAHFQKVMNTAEYANLPYARSTLGARAKSNLFELRHLSIGKTAPEIDGEDIDGNPIKLSDYRGKVVVIDFWGDW